MATRTFNFKKCAISFKGVLITGFMDGEGVVSVVRDNDAFTRHTGADGETSRATNNDKGGTATITLKQDSASNDYLSQQLQLDELTDANTGVFSVVDASGRTVLNCPEAWVKKAADVTLGQTIAGREWTIDLAKLDVFVGGN